MATNVDNARIFGSDYDAIYVAPIGTALPTTIDGVLAPAFEDVGWLSEDGITETPTGSVDKKRGHQGRGVVRSIVSEPGTTISFNALETKALNVGLRYDERSVSTVGGVRQARRSPGQKITPMAVVIDIFDTSDDSVKERYVIERLEITPDGERTINNADIAGLPFIGEVIGQYDHFMTVEDVS